MIVLRFFMKILDKLQFGIPGPMEGVMTDAFIKATTNLQLVPLWITPFLRISENVPKAKYVAKFLAPFLNSNTPTILQLMGTDYQKIAETAKIASDNFDICGINLNFGCPSKQVASGGAGGAALKNISLMQDILKAIKDLTPNTSLSAKIRLGYEKIDEMHEIIPAITKKEFGLDFIVIHTRLVKEYYLEIKNHAERRAKAIQLANNLPVIINGDINSAKEAHEIIKTCGAYSFMSGRPWLKNPAIFREFNQQKWDYNIQESKTLLYNSVIEESERLNNPYNIGKKIELASFIYGKDSDFFKNLIKQR